MQLTNTFKKPLENKIAVRLTFRLDGSTKDWIKTLALQGSIWQAKQQSIAKLLGKQIASMIAKSGHAHVSHFSNKIGVSQTTLQRIIIGKSNPRLSTLKKIAVGLGIPVNELLSIPNDSKDRLDMERDIIDVTLEFPIGTTLPQWLVEAIHSKGSE